MKTYDCVIHKYENVLSHRAIMAQGVLDWLEDHNLETNDLRSITRNELLLTILIDFVIDHCKRLEWFNDLDYNVWRSLVEDTLATL